MSFIACFALYNLLLILKHLAMNTLLSIPTRKEKKFKSFAELYQSVNASEFHASEWQNFLTAKGHTQTTFNYLPENLKTALRFSFARK